MFLSPTDWTTTGGVIRTVTPSFVTRGTRVTRGRGRMEKPRVTRIWTTWLIKSGGGVLGGDSQSLGFRNYFNRILVLLPNLHQQLRAKRATVSTLRFKVLQPVMENESDTIRPSIEWRTHVVGRSLRYIRSKEPHGCSLCSWWPEVARLWL